MLHNSAPRLLKPIPLRHPYSPYMGQAGSIVSFDPKVDVAFKPDVKVPINIELGGLPLSLGLFMGSGLSFLVRPQLPEGLAQTAALVIGAGLAVAGITNLVMPKAQAASAPASPSSSVPTTTAPSAPGGAASAPPGVAASEKYAFDGISGRVTYPGETEEVNIWATASSYPIRVQLYNPSSVSATFYLEIVANENPHPFGQEAKTTLPMQVTVGPGQTRDIDINMPITAWGLTTTYTEVDLTVYKRRLPNEDRQQIAMRFFVVT